MSAVRRARADVLYYHLAVSGFDAIEWLYEEMHVRSPYSAWTRARVDQALNDLARDGRVEVGGRRGYLNVEVLIDDEMAAYLGLDDLAVAA
jgi:hypothetical protein